MSSNRLYKLIVPSTPGAPGTPAVPGTPATPPYCQTSTVVTYEYHEYYGIDDNPSHLPPPQGTYGTIVFLYATYTPIYTQVTTCYPGSAGTPGKPAIPGSAPTAVNFNVGWTGSAASVGTLAGDGEFNFSIDPNSVGVVVGLNDTNEGSLYSEINYALYFESGKFRVMEAGTTLTGYGYFVAGDVFTIARVGRNVKYFQNGDLFFSSVVPNSGTLFADCSLYFGGDAIVNASLTDTVAADIRPIFPGNSGGTGGGVGDGGGGTPPAGSVPAPGGIGGAGVGGSFFVVLGSGANFAYTEARGSFRVIGGGQDNVANSGGTGLGAGGVSLPVGGVGGAGVGGSFVVFIGGGANLTYSEALGQYRYAGIGGDFIAYPPDESIGGGAGGNNAGLGPGAHAIGQGAYTLDGGGSTFAYTEGTGSFAFSTLGASSSLPDGSLAPGLPGLSYGGTGGGPGGSTPALGGSYFVVTSVGYAYDPHMLPYVMAAGSFELHGDGTANLLTPDYCEGRGDLSETFQGFGYGTLANEAKAYGYYQVIGQGSNFNYTEGRGSYQYTSLGVSQNYGPSSGKLDQLLFTHPYVLLGIGHTDEAVLYGTHGLLPRLQFIGYGGGVVASKKRQLHPYQLTASGTVIGVGRLQANLPRLTLYAYGTAPVVGRFNQALSRHHYGFSARAGAILTKTLPHLVTFGSTGTAPIIGRLDKSLPKHHYHLTACAGGYAAPVLPRLKFAASGTAVIIGRLTATLPHPYPRHIAAGGAVLSGHLPRLLIHGTATALILGRFNQALPAHHYRLASYAGGSSRGELPVPTLAGAGTAVLLGRLNAKLLTKVKHSLIGLSGGSSRHELPGLTLVASGTASLTGRTTANLPRPYVVVSTGGAILSAKLPLHTLVTASGQAAFVGRLSAVLPTLAFSGSATLAVLGRLDALLPALERVISGVLREPLPSLLLLATGTTDSGDVEYEAYSITLLDNVPDGQIAVAVTHLTDYPFDFIVRWRDKHYGVGPTGIFELSGDTFAGTPIVAVAQTMETNFDHAGFKRVPALYLAGRVGADLNVSVVAAELTTDTYAGYRPVAKAGAMTHRVLFGKGIRAHYIAYQFTNVAGEDFAIDTFEPEVNKLKRAV